MTCSYREHYSILGIQPGDDWQRLRDAYKRAVRVWHPDRFPHDHVQRRKAEEKTKLINRAYNELADYYRTHGVLPLAVPPAVSVTTNVAANDGAISAPPAANPHHDITPIQPGPPHKARPTAWLLFLTAGIGGGWLLWQALPDSHVPGMPPEGTGPVGTAETPLPGAESGKPAAQTFSVGSTLGQVYAAQGIPSKIENDVWHYGTARVHFRDGRVTRWDDETGTTLKARVELDTLVSVAGISRGSSKEDVRRFLGNPIRETDRVWEYGSSRVYFENDHVSGWKESPMSPLRR